MTYPPTSLDSSVQLRALRGHPLFTRPELRGLACGNHRLTWSSPDFPLTRLAALISELNAGTLSREEAFYRSREQWLADAWAESNQAVSEMQATNHEKEYLSINEKSMLILNDELLLSLIGPLPDEISLQARDRIAGRGWLIRRLPDAPDDQLAAWQSLPLLGLTGAPDIWRRRTEIPHLSDWLPHAQGPRPSYWHLNRNRAASLPGRQPGSGIGTLLDLMLNLWTSHSPDPGSQQTELTEEPLRAPGIPLEQQAELISLGTHEHTLTLLEGLSAEMAATGSGQKALGLPPQTVTGYVISGALNRRVEPLPVSDRSTWHALLFGALNWPGDAGKAAAAVATETLAWPHDENDPGSAEERNALKTRLSRRAVQLSKATHEAT